MRVNLKMPNMKSVVCPCYNKSVQRLLKSAFRKNTVSMEYLSENTPAAQDEEKREVLRAVLSLPDKYKNAVYLHYYEGYTAGEIGKIIGKKENSVYTLLARAREKLKKILGGDDFE